MLLSSPPEKKERKEERQKERKTRSHQVSLRSTWYKQEERKEERKKERKKDGQQRRWSLTIYKKERKKGRKKERGLAMLPCHRPKQYTHKQHKNIDTDTTKIGFFYKSSFFVAATNSRVSYLA